MWLENELKLRLLLLAACPWFLCATSSANSSNAFELLLSGAQQLLTWTGGEGRDSYIDYLKFSLRTELQKRLSPEARIIVEGEDDFDALDARYTNYRRPWYIAGVQVVEEKDVIETVNYARARGIPFAARSGGHSLTTSLRRIKYAIAIDMRKLNSIKYDQSKQQMTVGGGTATGELANATFAQGMEVIRCIDFIDAADSFEAVGSCPCTGVLGISLGAGIGRLQGKYGYLNDNMVSIRLLLANDTIVSASENENRDLFWAVRGAGHNFGTALEATYQVYPQQNNGRHYVVDFEFELDKVEGIFEVMNAISSPMPKEVAIFVVGRWMGANGKPTINVNLVYSGPEEDAAPFVEKFDAMLPVWKDAKSATWDALPWATYNGLNNILCTRQGWARFPIKNFYAANVKKYDISTMRSYFDEWRDMNQKYKGEAMFSVMFESFPQQRVRALPDDKTAYPWRHGSDHFLMIEAAYKNPVDEQLFDEWLSKHQDNFVASSGYGRLQQYINYGHGSKDPPEALYGYDPWRLEKLRQLKKIFDPEGWFNGYQPFIEEAELDRE